MAEPALWSPTLPYSVNDSPYSRTLQQIEEQARKRQEEDAKDNTDGRSTSSSESSSEEEEEDECVESNCPKLSQHDIAKYQKQQAWLRGGASATRGSDTASIRTTTPKKRTPPSRSPGLLETILLPRTTRAAVVRRHSTADGVSSKAPSIAPSIRSQRTTTSTARAERPKPQSRLSIFSSPSPPTPAVKIECITCLADDVPIRRSAKLECNHRMCHSCLKRIFTLSTTDPQLMPPRCCTENAIPLRYVDRLFDDEFKRIWNRKFAEYTTKARLYCPTKGCGAWIKPKYIELDRSTGRRMGTCKECKTKVCKQCNMRWHGHRECHNDDGTKKVIDLGKEHGWQRCYNCKAMVQLAEGCNHMRCLCNSEFCMVCGLKWKTCDCPWFNLPPDILRVNEYLLPPPPPPPNGMRGPDFGGFGIPPPPPPPGFRNGREIPMDPMNLPPMFEAMHIPQPYRPRPRRARTTPGANETPGREAQEAADEAFARQLQDQEFNPPAQMMDNLNIADEDPAVHNRQRVARRDRRRRVYAVTEDEHIVEYDPVTANAESAEPEVVCDEDEIPPGTEATMAGLRGSGLGRVESWRRHI